MKVVKRVYMTLIEILVALTLTSFLLSALLGYYRFINTLMIKTSKEQQRSFSERYFSFRLSRAFSSALKPNESLGRVFFSTGGDGRHILGNSLVWSYNLREDPAIKGSDIDPFFSGDLLARLYIDFENRLCLASWPEKKVLEKLEESFPMRKEVLAEKVERIDFLFYNPPTKEVEGDEDIDLQLLPNSWISEWQQNYKKLPAMMKIFIKEQGQQEVKQYSFVLHRAEEIIYFTDR